MLRGSRLSLVLAGGMVLVIMAGSAIAILTLRPGSAMAPPAQLTTADKSLIGTVDQHLVAQITFDAEKQAYVFNAAGKKSSGATQAPPGNDAYKKTVGLYSVDLPVDPSRGFTYYNNDLQLSFTVVPQFAMGRAQEINGRVVYPLPGDGLVVYTVKGNGLAEDIIFHRPVDSRNFSYKLQLPDTLEAKNIPGSGAIGIYSADARLFEHITFSTSEDQTKVMNARKNSPKNNLSFAIPAPAIKQTNPKAANGTGNVRYAFGATTLTVIGEGMRNLAYPISLDPSVVINTTPGFEAGNNEGDIDFGNNQINRGGLTGGVLGTWTTQTGTPLPATTRLATSVVADGYVYEIGGDPTGTGTTNNVYYAQLNSGGTLGSWNTATNLLPLADKEAVSVAYNGYIYEIGGCTTTCPATTVYYSQIGSNGIPGVWSTAAHSLNTARVFASAAVYDGYIYVVGGCSNSGCTTTLNSTEYAQINADGSVGAWATSATTLASGTYESVSAAYNGFLYEIGGYTTAATANVYYASIKSNGDINSWTTTSALTAATYDAAVAVDDGYVYVLGNNAGATVYYARFNANGRLDTWATNANALPSTTYQETAVAWSGYVFVLGGCAAACPGNVVVSAPVQTAGYNGQWATTTAMTDPTEQSCSVAYNGYIYELGGYSKPHSSLSATSKVYYAPLNADGSVGTWNTTTALTTATQMAACVAYNGYMYFLGGSTTGSDSGNVTTVIYVAINTNGTLAASWSTGTALPAAISELASTANNGYIYAIGGYTSSGTYNTTVYYTTLGAAGAMGATWNTDTNNFSLYAPSEFGVSATAYGGRIYVVGGGGSTSGIVYATVNSDGSTGAWTSSGSLQGGGWVYNGYVYFVSLSNAQGATEVDLAPINADGSVGTFVADASMTSQHFWGTTVEYNGYSYTLGGCNGSCTNSSCSGASCPVTTVEYSKINNGGLGTLGSWTAATNSLPATIDGATSVAYKGYLYEIGGFNGSSVVATIDYAPINSDGSIGTWKPTTTLLAPNYIAASVAYDGYLYEIGGCASTCPTSEVDYAPINSDGTVGTWTPTASLPNPTELAAATTYNGYLYEIGGCTAVGCSSITAAVDYAPINSNGTIGTWITSNSLPSPTHGLTSVAYNGYLYAIGGCTSGNCSAITATVDYVPLNSDGSVGSWSATASLPLANKSATAVAYNGYLYEIGGCTAANCSAIATTVDYAPIIGSGAIGSWTPTTALPTATESATSVAYSGYIYELGGYTTTQVATVDYVPVNSIPRTGHYSQLVDLGISNATLVTITYTGVLPDGLAAINFATAGSAGTLSSQAPASSLTGSNGASNIRYVWVFLTLDDSQTSGGYPDSASTTNADITKITINYSEPCSHPAPASRLRGGKSFSSGTQQALDTCFP